MWIDCQIWRKENGVDTIIETFEFPEYAPALKFYPRFYHKTDKIGRPIYIEQLGLLNLTQLFSVSTEERMQRNHVHEYERLIKYRLVACSIKSGRHFEQSTIIMDLKNVAISTFASVYGIVKGVSAVAQDYYPEMLGKMYVINAPMLFTGVWTLVKPMLDEATVNKIVILGSNYLPSLLETIDTESVPRFLGGTCSDCPEGCEHSDIGPWNDGSVEGYPKPEFERFALTYTAADIYRHVKNPFAGPIDVVKVTIREHGFFGLYRGLSALVLGTASKAGVRFLVFDQIKAVLADKDGKVTGGRMMLAGLGAGAMREYLLYKYIFDTGRTKLIQDQNLKAPRFKGLIHGTKIIIAEQGISGIYQGVTTVIARQGANSAIRLSAYGLMREKLTVHYKGMTIPWYSTFGIGAFAGIITVYTTMPLDVLKTKMQATDARQRYKHTGDCFVKTLKEEGVLAFWKGATPRLGRLI
ncbi:cytosolic factor, phosphatidylinositol/phosphatidylcholine transfer protein, partial [Physocladia obscura]